MLSINFCLTDSLDLLKEKVAQGRKSIPPQHLLHSSSDLSDAFEVNEKKEGTDKAKTNKSGENDKLKNILNTKLKEVEKKRALVSFLNVLHNSI